MIYDMKAHLPQIMNNIMEDFRAGDIVKLEADKYLVSKLFSDNSFDIKIKLFDDEHSKRKEKTINDLKELELKKMELAESLEKIERDYWETVIGELVRQNDKTPSPVDVEPVDE